ncbi:MAG: isoprenylcysteine carboxylmethyltransferase family protein [Candidatus Neomarinimicrobiota bacterium]
MNRRPLFAIGTTGMVATAVIWVLAVYVERWLGISPIEMGATFRWIFFTLFAADFSATVLWSLVVLAPSRRETKLMTAGPYRWVRHPLYSAIIFSGTGMVAIWHRSWAVIFSVIIINFFWTWHVRKEERDMLMRFGEEYREYMRSTGQFFPRFRPLESDRD